MTVSYQSGLRLAPRDGQRKQDVLLCAERRDQVVGLEDEADPIAAQVCERLVTEVGQVQVADDDVAGGRLVQSGQAVHERGLA
jgi:hypothetical protein